VVLQSIEQTGVKNVITARRFIKKLKTRGIILADETVANRIYLEDIRQNITTIQGLMQFLIARCLPAWLLTRLYCEPLKLSDTAVILFSSGSEGVPKGIELSYANILSNIKQISSIINADHDDVVLSSLPLFHAFGLAVTTLMPLLEGIPLVCHPDPTDTKNEAGLITEHKITLLFTTSTFLRFYTKNPHIQPLMLQSLRTVVTGAEQLHPEVRKAFQNKFGIDIFEGYGTTETSPVISVNSPDLLLAKEGKVQIGQKIGTVGMPLPGTMVRIVDPKTLKELPTGEAGLILVGGPQVMKGYLKNAARTESVISYQDGIGWYHTGDKGYLDEEGFLTIIDRYSRFAKRGGEMISLTALEERVEKVFNNDELEFLSVVMPDEKKGEKIILLISGAKLPAEQMMKELRQSGIPPLMLPDNCIMVEEIPKLGSGKYDLVKAKRLVQEI